MDQSIDYNNQFQCGTLPQEESLCSKNDEDINNTINYDEIEINDTMNGTPTPTDNNNKSGGIVLAGGRALGLSGRDDALLQ